MSFQKHYNDLSTSWWTLGAVTTMGISASLFTGSNQMKSMGAGETKTVEFPPGYKVVLLHAQSMDVEHNATNILAVLRQPQGVGG